MTRVELATYPSAVEANDWPDLSCPFHRVRLEQKGDILCCPQGEKFFVQHGIPRFVNQRNYAEAFGAQWKKYRLTQLDSFSGVPITEERLRRCLGEKLWTNLAGKHVLECGCGAGRFTEILLRQGALVTSIDLSDAVEANQQTFPQSGSHRIVQADILRAPFRLGQFDIVLCLGVIQHTPKPEATMTALAGHMKAGGALVIDHYTYHLSEFTKIATLLRFVFKRLPVAMGLRWTERMVRVLLPFHKGVRRWPVARTLLSRLSPVVCYYQAYPQLNDGMQYEWALVDTHDFLTCWYRRFRTRTQIERVMQSLGLQEVACWYGGNGVEARALRPLQSRAK
jgi:2-polyprenyl-3-methyl-5-hydroxy-6-metoxy-1,4-benzoquinol methylase